MTLAIARCTESAVWDAFVASSPQGTIFCRTVFLAAQGKEYDLWLLERDGDLQAGAVVMVGDCRPYLYQGILYGSQSRSLQPHRRAKWTLEVTEKILAELSGQYERLSFWLHHSLDDLRGFQWFHYHEPDLGQFNLGLRYTGLLDIDSYHDFGGYLSCIRKVRRYEYRRGAREGLTIEVSRDIDTLDRLHEATFERQGIERRGEKELLSAIGPAALANGFGELLVCRDGNGEAISATFFLYDENCGYYLFGANHPEYRSAGGGTTLMLENIRRCFERKLKRVDFVGVNSPNRGDFKTSFNAIPVPYFVVTWECP